MRARAPLAERREIALPPARVTRERRSLARPTGNSVFMPLLGIGVGHLYYFLVDVAPEQAGIDIIRTPAFVVEFFGGVPSGGANGRPPRARRAERAAAAAAADRASAGGGRVLGANQARPGAAPAPECRGGDRHEKSHLAGKLQPDFCMTTRAAKCPARTHSAIGALRTSCDKKPPTNLRTGKQGRFSLKRTPRAGTIAHARVAGAVSVHEQLLREGLDGKLVRLPLVCENRRSRSLRDDNDPRARPRRFGLRGELERDRRDVRSPTAALAEHARLGLVAKKEIDVRHRAVKLLVEILDHERRGEVQRQDFRLFGGVPRDLQHGLGRDREEETGQVVELRAANNVFATTVSRCDDENLLAAERFATSSAPRKRR